MMAKNLLKHFAQNHLAFGPSRNCRKKEEEKLKKISGEKLRRVSEQPLIFQQFFINLFVLFEG